MQWQILLFTPAVWRSVFVASLPTLADAANGTAFTGLQNVKDTDDTFDFGNDRGSAVALDDLPLFVQSNDTGPSENSLSLPFYASNHNKSLVMTKHPPATVLPMSTFIALSINYISDIWRANSNIEIPIGPRHGIQMGTYSLGYEAKLPIRPTDIAHALASVVLIEATLPRNPSDTDWLVERFAIRAIPSKVVVAGIVFKSSLGGNASSEQQSTESLGKRKHGIQVSVIMLPDIRIFPATVAQVFLYGLSGLMWHQIPTTSAGRTAELKLGKTWESRYVNGMTLKVRLLKGSVCDKPVTVAMLEEGMRLIWMNMPNGMFTGGFNATIEFTAKKGPPRVIAEVLLGRFAASDSSPSPLDNTISWTDMGADHESVQVYRRDDECGE